MNRRLLALSVAVNMALLLWAIAQFRKTGPRAESRTSAVQGHSDSVANSASRSAPRSGPSANSPFSWDQLDRSTWFTFRDSLLRIGCPKRSIREILEPQMNRAYETQIREMMQPYLPIFWEITAQTPTNGWVPLQSKFQAFQQAFDALKEGLFEGFPNPGSDSGTPETADGPFSFLPPEIAVRAEDVWNQYIKQKEAAAMDPTGQIEGWATAFRDLREQRDAAWKSFLSTDEFLQLSLRMNSNLELARMKDSWGALSLSARELKGVAEIQERYLKGDGASADEADIAKQNAEIETLLGADKAHELRQAAEPGYQEYAKLLSRLELPTSQITPLQEIERQALTERNLILASPVSNAERQRQLDALKDQLAGEVRRIQGSDRGFLTWKHYKRGWLETTFQIPFDILFETLRVE